MCNDGIYVCYFYTCVDIQRALLVVYMEFFWQITDIHCPKFETISYLVVCFGCVNVLHSHLSMVDYTVVVFSIIIIILSQAMIHEQTITF